MNLSTRNYKQRKAALIKIMQISIAVKKHWVSYSEYLILCRPFVLSFVFSFL